MLYEWLVFPDGLFRGSLDSCDLVIHGFARRTSCPNVNTLVSKCATPGPWLTEKVYQPSVHPGPFHQTVNFFPHKCLSKFLKKWRKLTALALQMDFKLGVLCGMSLCKKMA